VSDSPLSFERFNTGSNTEQYAVPGYTQVHCASNTAVKKFSQCTEVFWSAMRKASGAQRRPVEDDKSKLEADLQA
jgi:hypothetical protein